jgi:hypothetical protein
VLISSLLADFSLNARQESFQNLEKKQSKQFQQWHGHSVDVRSGINLPAKRQPWTELCGAEPLMFGLRCGERVHDLLNVALWSAHVRHPEVSLDDLPGRLWVNISQGVQLNAWTLDGPGTWTTNGFWYHYGTRVVLSGELMLQLLGWPKACSSTLKFSDGDCRKLAGDGYSLPIAGSIALLLYLNPWRASDSS